MAISPLVARLIIKEHKIRSLPEVVYTIGRQTMDFNYSQALGLFAEESIAPKQVDVSIDKNTRRARKDNSEHITDKTFFGMLGVSKVIAIDVTQYEGADIIADLNYMIPDTLCDCADFVVDGSCLDNVFNPSMMLDNIGRLLRPLGRFVANNAATARETTYVVFSPLWFLDYFAINRYRDCLVIINDLRADGAYQYRIDNEADFRTIQNFQCQKVASIIVLAEKGYDSTFGIFPNQNYYRPESEWKNFSTAIRQFVSARSDIKFFTPNDPLNGEKGNRLGYNLIGRQRF
jgi:hypothetical protein